MYTSTTFVLIATIFGTAITQDIPGPISVALANNPPKGATNVAISSNTQSLGDLSGDDLVNKVTKALQGACPEPAYGFDPTFCANDPNGLSIDGVAVITEPGNILGSGSIILTIKEGNYSYAAQRDGMIAVFAQTLKVAATGNNCQTNVPWQSGCSLGVSGGGKRSTMFEEPRIKGRAPISPPQGVGPEQDCQRGTKTMCSGPDNIDIEIDAVDGGNTLAILNVDVTFDSPYKPFDCVSFLATLGVALGAVGFGVTATALGLVAPACSS